MLVRTKVGLEVAFCHENCDKRCKKITLAQSSSQSVSVKRKPEIIALVLGDWMSLMFCSKKTNMGVKTML